MMGLVKRVNQARETGGIVSDEAGCVDDQSLRSLRQRIPEM
jgi:hypothetical protein